MVKQAPQDEKMARAAEELRALIREAHEAAKDLISARKEVEEAIVAGAQLMKTTGWEMMEPWLEDMIVNVRKGVIKACEALIGKAGSTLQDQVYSWDRQIREKYAMAQRPGLVIDMTGLVPLVFDRDSEEGQQAVLNGPAVVVIDGKNAPSFHR